MFGNQKGGVGKSTLTALVANALAADPFNLSVIVLDVDPQRSLIRRRLMDLDGYNGETPYRLEAMTLADFMRDIYRLDEQFDLILIDAPGKMDNTASGEEPQITTLLRLVDFLLIPFVPGNYSLEASQDFLRLALTMKAKRRNDDRPLTVAGVINMFEGSRTIDDRFLIDELEEIRALVNIPMIRTPLNRYALFRNVDTLTSFYEPGSNDRAIENFTHWLNDLRLILDAPRPEKA